MLHGIDIASYQSGLNLTTVKGQIDFVVIHIFNRRSKLASSEAYIITLRPVTLLQRQTTSVITVLATRGMLFLFLTGKRNSQSPGLTSGSKSSVTAGESPRLSMQTLGDLIKVAWIRTADDGSLRIQQYLTQLSKWLNRGIVLM